MSSMSGRQDRTPIFLDRNLTRVLQVHHHLVKHGNTQGIPGPDHDLRPVWRPPSWDALDDMIDIEKSRGSFVLNVHGLKPLNPAQSGAENEPTRKLRSLFSAQSTLQVSIYTKGADLPCKRLPPQTATVKGADGSHGKRVYIETDQMVVNRGDLSIAPSEHEARFHESYKLILAINLDSSQDAIGLYTHLGCKSAEKDAHTRLIATFGNILECPQGPAVLPLKDRQTKLDFGIEVSMYWSDTRTESILTTHNQQLKSLFQPDSYPTPPLDVEQPKYKLTFVYAKEILTRPGLSCPHELCRHKRPTTIDGLRLHLVAWHDHFKYHAFQELVDNDGVEHWKFECDVADHKADQRASARVDEPFDVHIIAPSKPFNQRSYLHEGDDEYYRAARSIEKPAKQITPIITSTTCRRKPPEEVSERPTRRQKTYRVPKAPPGVTFFRSLSKRPLVKGEAISESDDDMDTDWIDLRKTTELEKAQLLPESAKRFLKGFDRFLFEESLQSDGCAGDALVRFVRSKGAWIWQEGVFRDFRTKIDELLDDNIISKEVHTSCLETLTKQKPDAQDAHLLSQRLAALDVQPETDNNAQKMHSQGKRDKAKGKAKVTETGHITPITADSDGDVDMGDTSLSSHPIPYTTTQQDVEEPPYDLCLCGKDALSSARPSSVVACNSIDCVRRYFHFSCVKQQQQQQHIDRPAGWLDTKKGSWTCDECKCLSNTAM